MRNRKRPHAVENATHVTTAAGGDYHSLFVSESVLYTFGQNTDGQLGLGDTTDRHSPVKVTSGVKLVAGGEKHSLYVDEEGMLYAFGNNDFGQLGVGDNQPRHSPVKVNSLNNNKVRAISAGEFFSIYVDEADLLVGFGYNGYGMLCFADLKDRLLPTQISDSVSIMAAGKAHQLFVNSGGLFACGCNRFGQLGTGDIADRHVPTLIRPLPVTNVAAGDLESYIVSDGVLYATGWNYYGQLGLGDNTKVKDAYGELNYKDYWSFTPVTLAKGVKALASGAYYGVYADASGHLYSFGYGGEGNLGNNNTLDSNAPVRVVGSASHVVVV
jgi:alpha-tubulin suppressor-like RCC1 family protein